MKPVGFDICCKMLFTVNPTKSAISESACIDIRGMSMQEPAYRNKDLARFIIRFSALTFNLLL